MRLKRRTRTGSIVAASLAVHAAILTVLALHAPRLRAPKEASGPPEAVIPVLIIPRVPPPSAAPGTAPQPIRLHRRPQPFVQDETPVAPLVAPVVEAKGPPPTAPGPRTVTGPPPPDDALAANARNALRGRLGCANANLLNLSRAEREACERQLAAGAKEADYLGTGIDADKARGLAAAARRKEADYAYMRGGTPPGTVGAGPSASGQAPGRANLPGSTAESIGKMVGSDKPTLKVPF